MILDSLLQFSAAQAVTVLGNTIATNVIDLSQSRDIGSGGDLYVHFGVPTAFTSGGSATLQAQVIVADSADLVTNPVIVGASDVMAVASLTSGKQFVVELNPQLASIGKRYMGVRYVVGTAAMTAGAINANITVGVQDGLKFYPSGFTAAV
jgi:hypothetical protein